MNLYANTIYKPNSIRVLFQLNTEVDNALNLLKETIPTISSEEVSFWYERFNKGDFDISQDLYKRKETPTLNMLPVMLKRKITDQVNIRDQDALVRVNKGFRTYLTADRRVFSLVKIRLNENEAVLRKVYKDNKEEKIIITKSDEGCIVDENGETTTYENSYVEQVLIEFRKTIKKCGTKIAHMKVKFKSEVQGDNTEGIFLKGISDVFSELKKPLHVENFYLYTNEATKVNSILGNIEVGALNKLRCKVTDPHTIDMQAFTNLAPHVPFLRLLLMPLLSFENVPLSNFAHIPFVLLKAVISQQELSDYKNTLINSSIEPDHTFFTTLSREEIKEALRPYETISSDMDKFKGSFRHALLDKKIKFVITRYSVSLTSK